MRQSTKWSNQILEYVAAHSPKSFKPLIIERNKQALTWLEAQYKLWLANQPFEDTLSLPLGCPHCGIPCSQCIWTKAAIKLDKDNKRIAETCCQVEFNGTAYYTLSRQHMAKVKLTPTGIEVSFFPPKTTDTWSAKGDFHTIYFNCINFLKGHIDWATNYGSWWGSLYRKPKKLEQKLTVEYRNDPVTLVTPWANEYRNDPVTLVTPWANT